MLTWSYVTKPEPQRRFPAAQMLTYDHICWPTMLPASNALPTTEYSSMRLARALSAYNQHNPTIDNLVESAQLDVLQLDCLWPQRFSPDRPPWSCSAKGFLRQVQTLHRALYVDPNLHLISNAGGFDTLECVEAIGQLLSEQGSGKLPVTAIRGDNLFPQLEELMAEGIELKDQNTGRRLQDFTRPILAAQCEIGAGPLATALQEGSRLVVAGCYDNAAPLLAAAVSGLRYSWDQADDLVQLAVATHLPKTIIDIDPERGLTVEPYPGMQLNPSQLRHLLLQDANPEGMFQHAEVGCRVNDVKLLTTDSGALRIANVTGEVNQDNWLLKITCAGDYVVQAVFKCTGEEITTKQVLAEIKTLQESEYADNVSMKIDPLLNPDGPDSLISVCSSSKLREPSEALVRDLTNLSANFSTQAIQQMAQLDLQQEAVPVWCEVPRDALSISVDTRPAEEWR